jgi:serine/threonine-protein kinase
MVVIDNREADTVARGSDAFGEVATSVGRGSVVANRYRLLESVGHGGTSIVYRAYQVDLDRMVALKILAIDPADERMGERLQREARVIAGIVHPALTQIYEIGVTVDGRPFIAMELLSGESLADRLDRVGRLAPRDAVEIAAQIAAGLGVVHDKGYIHRDVKPSNVFLATSAAGETVKLLDFGTVRRLRVREAANDPVVQRTLMGVGTQTIQTLPGIVFGTPWYMSPEQAAGLPLRARSDQYALGVVVYEMLTGSAPYDDALPGRILAKHIAEPLEPMSQRAPDAAIPRELEVVVMRALAKDPDLRFAKIGDFATALVKALSQPTALVDAPPQPMERRAPPQAIAVPVRGARTRHRGVFAALIVVGVLAVGSFGVLAWLGSKSHARKDAVRAARFVTTSVAQTPLHASESTSAASRSNMAPIVSPVLETPVLPEASSRSDSVSTRSTRAPARIERRAADPRAPDYFLPELKSFSDKEKSP